MKIIKSAVICLMITLTPVSHSKAAVGGIMAIAGAAHASSVALAGLASGGIGFLATTNAGSCDGGTCAVYLLAGLFVGAVLLDNDSGSFEFMEISEKQALKLGISVEKAQIYNDELGEVNLVFSEVANSLNSDSTAQEARELWSDYKDYVQPETFEVLQAIVK